MTEVLQIGNQILTPEQLIALLQRYKLLPQLLRQMAIDEAIAVIDCTAEEKATAQENFYERNQLKSSEDIHEWCENNGVNQEELEELTTRELKIKKFKELTWSNKVEAHFTQRKDKLDRVIYSLIRVQDAKMAHEIYFRIQEGEESFSQLARKYSLGPEAKTGGYIGPVSISIPHPTIRRMLLGSTPGQLWHPIRLEKWIVIVRLEELIHAELDANMRGKILDELFNMWLKEEVKKLGSIRLRRSINNPQDSSTSNVA